MTLLLFSCVASIGRARRREGINPLAFALSVEEKGRRERLATRGRAEGKARPRPLMIYHAPHPLPPPNGQSRRDSPIEEGATKTPPIPFPIAVFAEYHQLLEMTRAPNQFISPLQPNQFPRDIFVLITAFPRPTIISFYFNFISRIRSLRDVFHSSSFACYNTFLAGLR